ncbi:unnamed protein product [Caenorhabditis angaria]|uniref:G-protein coupled receptors family 1 profile domain-containing protein n=1 Tax=Caenorhabditis angaria TaxID=860376 RepID=A0A9P1IZK3_9PELO|nr:unnamed protein product [Caenorhabditis angaria]
MCQFLTCYWQIDLMLIETTIILPIYVFLLFDISICHFRKTHFQSQYYSLVISQAIADICTALCVIYLYVARYLHFGNNLLFNSQIYGSGIFISEFGPIFFIIRFFGIFLMTFQRYQTVCSKKSITYNINNLSFCKIFLIHFLVPFLIYIPCFSTIPGDLPFFNNSDELSVINSGFRIKFFSMTVIVVFIFFGTLDLFMYISIIYSIWKTKKVFNVSRKNKDFYQEIRLLIHILLLVCTSTLTFLYYLNEFLGSAINSNSDNRKDVRRYYAIIAVNFGYINPIILIFLNRDVKMRAKKFWVRSSTF